jgi:predicted DNA-binding transcriptional regulator YafY
MTDLYAILSAMKSMKTKKSFPRTSLPRIYFIDSRIASGAYPNTSRLAAEYEVSVATISRDIELMRDRLDAPIGYDAARRGYYYTEKTFRLPAGYASARDMLALGMAKTLLTFYRNTPLHDAAEQLLDGILEPLAADGASMWHKDRIVVPPAASGIVPEGVWEPLITGLRENRVIIFEYSGIWDEGYKPRRVRPYQLLFDSGVWYLYGYAEERKALRMFSLPRMRNAAAASETFTLPGDFDYRLNSDDSHFGVFAGGERQQFAIAFYDDSEAWVRERQWADDEEIEETEDGVVIRFSSTQYYKVLEWVLSRGCNAQPLSPEALVDDWTRHITGMGKLIK